jgi:hypothetical protein
MISRFLLLRMISASKKILHTNCVINSNINWQSLTLSFEAWRAGSDPALSHSSSFLILLKRAPGLSDAHRIEEGGLLDVKINLHDTNSI